jgi:hypothetical protein
MQNYETLDKLRKLGIDPNDPEIKGRPFHSFKETFKSIRSDPWMESAFTINRSFLGWIATQRKVSTGFCADIPNLKAEIRNDFIRARDLWEDYLVSKGEVAPLTLGYEAARPVLTASMEANLKVKRSGVNRVDIARATEDQYRKQNWQQNKPRYLTHEYLDFVEAENLRRTKILNQNHAQQ